MEYALLSLYCLLLSAYAFAVRGRGGWLNPDGLFVALNSLMLLGVTLQVDFDNAVQRKYIFVVYGLTSLYVFTSTAIRVLWSDRHRTRLRVDIWFPRWGVALLVLSIVISVGYFWTIGYVTTFESLQSLLSGTSYDTATARLESYAGNRYFFPGYVNQFKNAILPALALSLVYVWRTRLKHGSLLVAGFLTLSTVILLTGTGQRGAMVTALLFVAVSLQLGGVMSPPKWLGLGSVGVVLFAGSTTLLGRRADDSAASPGGLNRLVDHLDSLVSRVLLENPSSGIAAFKYTEELPFAGGSDWFHELLGVFPGYSTHGISGEIFASVYGSTRGTMPPSTWGSVYFNFGPVGSLTAVALMSIVFCCVTNTFSKRLAESSISILELTGIGGISVAMGTWIAGTPMTMLNQGLPGFLIVYWLGKYAWPCSSRSVIGTSARTPLAVNL